MCGPAITIMYVYLVMDAHASFLLVQTQLPKCSLNPRFFMLSQKGEYNDRSQEKRTKFGGSEGRKLCFGPLFVFCFFLSSNLPFKIDFPSSPLNLSVKLIQEKMPHAGTKW